MKKETKNKRILITGSQGFIGTNLVNHLFDKHMVSLYDKNLYLDIFEDTLEDDIKSHDIVVHLAASTSVHSSFKTPEETFYTNAIGTARVAQLCVKYKKKLIYPSSAAVFHPELSPYAKSKWVAEEIVKGIMGKTDVVILRFTNVFGPHMNPNSGSIMYNFLTSKNIVVYGDGEQTRDFIHVRDVARIIEDTFKKKWNGKIVDVGMGQSYSANYVAGLFAHYRNKKVQYKPPRREIKWSIADTTLLKMLYKKPLTTNLEEDIFTLCQN